MLGLCTGGRCLAERPERLQKLVFEIFFLEKRSLLCTVLEAVNFTLAMPHWKTIKLMILPGSLLVQAT